MTSPDYHYLLEAMRVFNEAMRDEPFGTEWLFREATARAAIATAQGVYQLCDLVQNELSSDTRYEYRTIEVENFTLEEISEWETVRALDIDNGTYLVQRRPAGEYLEKVGSDGNIIDILDAIVNPTGVCLDYYPGMCADCNETECPWDEGRSIVKKYRVSRKENEA
jgi:hypothetical protein